MVQPTGSIRQLQYPLNRSEDLESDTPNTPDVELLSLDGWSTVDSDERVNVVLNLSLNEYVALATAVDVGRDVAYGDNSIYVWWIWVRSLISMSLCDDILDCIENTQEIQDAISYYSSTSNIQGDSTEIQANLDSELVNNPAGCDNDIIFGMTMQLVEFADRLIKDLFENLSAAQLSSVNVGYIIKLIPVLETLPIDEIFELTDKLINDMETAYLSASTSLLKEDIACDLFCMAVDNGCTLTLEEVRDYFETKSGEVFTYTDVLDFIIDFTNGTFVGNAVYYAMNILFFQIFAFGGKWLDWLFSDYLKTINSMYNDPNSDWSTLCDCGWTETFDFTVTQTGWTIRNLGFGYMGTWQSGVGFVASDLQPSGGDYRRVVSIQADFTESTITSIEMTYDYVQGNVDAPGLTAMSVSDLNNDVIQSTQSTTFGNMSDGTDQTELLTATDDADEIRLYLASSRNASSPVYGGTAIITKCVVTGTGTNPF